MSLDCPYVQQHVHVLCHKMVFQLQHWDSTSSVKVPANYVHVHFFNQLCGETFSMSGIAAVMMIFSVAQEHAPSSLRHVAHALQRRRPRTHAKHQLLRRLESNAAKEAITVVWRYAMPNARPARKSYKMTISLHPGSLQPGMRALDTLERVPAGLGGVPTMCVCSAMCRCAR